MYYNIYIYHIHFIYVPTPPCHPVRLAKFKPSQERFMMLHDG